MRASVPSCSAKLRRALSSANSDNPLAERSRSQQERLNDAIDEQAKAFIAVELLARIDAVLGELCRCEVEVDHPHVINVRYPAAFPDTYLRPEVRLEIGPLAAWLPHEDRTIGCYAAQIFPKLFEQPECVVRVISAQRTFCEKATILHHEAYRPKGGAQPARYSRHYYDLARMAASPVRNAALADFDLLADVVAFKQRFYPRGWARYDQAAPGSLRRVPGDAVLATVEADYRAMANMILGAVPPFADILATLAELEQYINKRKGWE